MVQQGNDSCPQAAGERTREELSRTPIPCLPAPIGTELGRRGDGQKVFLKLSFTCQYPALIWRAINSINISNFKPVFPLWHLLSDLSQSLSQPMKLSFCFLSLVHLWRGVRAALVGAWPAARVN